MSFVSLHEPCPDCGSSDGLSVNENGSTKCFVCGTFKKGSEGFSPVQATQALAAPKKPVVERSDAFYGGFNERRITLATAERFQAQQTTDGLVVFGYYDEQGMRVAQKLRTKEKKMWNEGAFSEAGLYGQHLFSKGGKYVTIVEGEFDAMAVYQMLGSKYPVVSVKSGAAGALGDCRTEYEWLNSFENIVICMDGDEPGQQAAKKIAELFGPKAKVFKPIAEYKDGCDFLKDRKEKEFVDRWWQAERYTPDGIVCGSNLWEVVNKPLEKADCLYPWEGLNKITYGIRVGELVTVTAGSGLGKSQFLREIVWHILNKDTGNIGLMFLEESVRKTALSLMSLSANKPLHLPDTEKTDEEMREAFEKTMGTDRLFFFDHFGSTDIDNIVNKVRDFVKMYDCKYVLLDHISIVVSSQENGDERKAIDKVMTDLRTLVQNLNIALLVVSHLKRPENKGHEEGAATSLAQLRGSGSIAQLSDMVIGLERNGQADDAEVRNTTRVRVLKNRFSGQTGPATNLLYSLETGRMNEVEEAL